MNGPANPVASVRQTNLKPDIPPEGRARIVVAIEDASEREEIARQLRADRVMRIEEAGSWDELAALLDISVIDVLIVGKMLSGVSALETVARIDSLYRDPPSAVMLGPSDINLAIKAFRCGFADYLTETTRAGQSLRNAVTRAARSAFQRRVDAIDRLYLEQMARRDALTGVLNADAAEEKLLQLVRVTERYKRPFAIILVRIRELERISSRFGHRIADRVLAAFAKKLIAESRSADTIARLDFDTFLYVIDHDATEPSITGASRRLAGAMAISLELNDVKIAVAPAIGWAFFPGDAVEVGNLLRVARSRFNLEEPQSGAPDPAAAAATAEVAAPSPAEPPAAEDQASIDRAENRRMAVRHRTFKRGFLVLNEGFSTVNCIIRDMSASGARVAVEGAFIAPDRMQLLVAESNTRHPVEKRWQRENQIGVKFLDVADAAPDRK